MLPITIYNRFLGILSALLFFNLLAQMACKKDEKCNNNDCPGMLSCRNNECSCPEDNIVVAGSLCIYPETHNFIALSDAGGNLPENFFFYFVGNSDTIQGPIGEYFGDEVGYNAPEYHRSGSIFTSYFKASFPPEGVTGDAFRLPMPYPVYPAGSNGGYCNLTIEGTFTHPDTIATIVRFESCKPATIPEANNQYRVTFVRIKRP